jgi:hypothetical protein
LPSCDLPLIVEALCVRALVSPIATTQEKRFEIAFTVVRDRPKEDVTSLQQNVWRVVRSWVLFC